MVEPVAKQLRSPSKLADQLFRVGVNHELVRIEAMSGVRLEGPLDAVGVHRAGTCGRQVSVPHLVRVLGQLDAFELSFAASVENAQLDFGRVGREEREIDAETVPCGTERKRLSFANCRAL